jgi:hypothetical protein
MKPENERIALGVLEALRKSPATIEELANGLRQLEDRTRYVVTQLVKKNQVVRLEGRRYGHAERVSQSTPPPLFSN